MSRLLQVLPRRIVQKKAVELAGLAPARMLHTTTPARASKEYTGVGLETDPNTGVRINKEAFWAFPGKPRSPEYDSVLEQDPFGNKPGSGANDDIFGEWGLERHAPQWSLGKALTVFTGFWSCMALFGYTLYKYDHRKNRFAAPREGVWGEGKHPDRI